jgi:hypothetical protein
MNEEVKTDDDITYVICDTCYNRETLESPSEELPQDDIYTCDYCMNHDMTDLETRVKRKLEVMPNSPVTKFPELLAEMMQLFEMERKI